MNCLDDKIAKKINLNHKKKRICTVAYNCASHKTFFKKNDSIVKLR